MLEKKGKVFQHNWRAKALQEIKDMNVDWNQIERKMEEKRSLINDIENKQIEDSKHQDLEIHIRSVGFSGPPG